MPQHTAVATLHTNYGDIVVNLFGDHAPRTVQNFIGLVRRHQATGPTPRPASPARARCTRTSSSTASSRAS